MELHKDDPLQPEHCAEMLSALASPERLRIVRFLGDGPQNVTAISEMLKIALVNVSHHLNVLHQAGIINRRKQGRFVLYSLAPGVLQPDCNEKIARLNLGCCRIEVPAEDADASSEKTDKPKS
jgi:DNA-binding transcriptional ArsR family regulator